MADNPEAHGASQSASTPDADTDEKVNAFKARFLEQLRPCYPSGSDELLEDNADRWAEVFRSALAAMK